MKSIGRRTLMGCGFAAAVGSASSRAHAETREEMAARIFARLHPTTGTVRIDAARMTIDLPAGYGLLGPADTRTLFVDLYGNPPGDSDGVLGTIIPLTVLPGTPTKSFEIAIRARPGRIADTGPGADLDPAVIDRAYHLFNARMAEQRAAAGAPVLSNQRIVEPARYDRARHQLTVARAFQWPDEDFLSVNYSTYQLTRDGLVQFLATSSLVTLPRIESSMDALLPTVRFDPGQRYEDGTALPISKLELRMMAIGMSADE